jgi:hypothetical protein
MVIINYSEYVPGLFVMNNNNKEWGIGQIQSSIDQKITVNFENVGKKVLNIEKISLEIVEIK